MLMIVLLMLAAYARQVIAQPRMIRPLSGTGASRLAAAAGLALWQSGSLMVSSDDGLEIAGFGGWSANLLTFIMPIEGREPLRPGSVALRTAAASTEGYAYLGAGHAVARRGR